ncbi:RNA polymerase sigma factor [Microbacterium sp. NPDC057650]|uniref:RNA polymerase sigma factor n=1 Tax=unclassified Microbacterium TaxID=2609290 RepID=UPI00366B122C
MEGTPEKSAPADLATDRTLVAAFRRGDADAFQSLFHRHVPAVHALIRSQLADEDTVDEVLQEVFTFAWERLDENRMPGGSALPWMLSIGQEQIANAERVRSTARTSTRPSALSPSARAPLTELDPVAELALTATLEAAVARLDAIDQEIVCQCLVHGLTYKEAVRRVRPTGGMIREWLLRRRGGATF